MSSSNLRGRGAFPQDTLSAEFTTGQIVIMASIALVVAGAMFGLGVIVGRVDSSAPVAATAATSPQAESAPAGAGAPAVVVGDRPEPLVSDAPVEAVETTPAAAAPPPESSPVVESAALAEPGEPDETAAEDEAKPVVTTMTGTLGDNLRRVTRVEALPLTTAGGAQNAPRISTTPPLPQESKPETPAAGDKPTDADKKPAETPAAPVSKKPTPLTVADDMEAAALLEEMPVQVAQNQKPEAAKPTPVKQPVQEAAPVTPSTGPAGKFGIQVGSFRGAGAEGKAAALAGSVSQSGQNARVLPAGDGTTYRVVIVGFADRAAANAALGKVKQQAGMGDAFVKSLP